jgi:hypothetical protein
MADSSLNSLIESLDSNQRELEERLARDFNIKASGWLLSSENVTVMEKIIQAFADALMIIQGISPYQAFQYLILYTDLQKIARTFAPELVHGVSREKMLAPLPEDKRQELIRIKEDAWYQYIFASAVYGKSARVDYTLKGNAMLSSWEENFLKNINLQPEDLLYTSWKSVTYKPVFTLVRDRSLKKLILCIRGTKSISDLLTDIDAQYFNISLRKDPSGKLYLKIHYTSNMDLHLKQKIVSEVPIINFEEESKVNIELEEEKVESHKMNGVNSDPSKNAPLDEELYRGWIHTGMLTAALGIFHEIKPVVEKTFADPEYDDFQFNITGHSLGGGMSTILTLLFLVYPPPSLKNPSERIMGYTFATAAVLSKEFFPLLRENLISVINETDMVPRLSTGSARDLLHVIRNLDLCEQKEPGVTKKIVAYALKEDEQSQANRPEGIQKTLELFKTLKDQSMNSVKLLPQGRIFLMTKELIEKEEQKVFVEIDSCEYFDSLIVSRDFLINHLPKSYDTSMREAKII